MSFWDDIKKFAQPYAADEDYDDYDDEDMDDGYAEESVPAYTAPRREAPVVDNFASTSAPTTAFSAPAAAPAATTGFNGTVLNTGASSSNKQQVILTRPESFNDAPAIAQNLRNKKAVVLNLEGVDKAMARRVVDFLSGCAYALDGSVKKVSQATYLFCPYNMEVQGDLKSLQAEVESYI